MLKFSIIIPIYNAEKYISKCLNSIISQTYQNFEVLCVNDGSKDSSLDILRKYAQNDSRIRIISQENLGVSVARNTGISHSTGEYVIFIDADDYLDLNALFILNKYLCDKNIDLLEFQYKNVVCNKRLHLLSCNPMHKNNNSFYAYDKLDEIFSPKEIYILCWNKVYKTDFLKKNHLYFLNQQKFAEDTVFVLDVLDKNPSMKIINDYLYYHVINDDSVTRTNSSVIFFHSIKDLAYHFEKFSNEKLYIYSIDAILYSLLTRWKPLYYMQTTHCEYYESIKKYLSIYDKFSTKKYKSLSSNKMAKKYILIEKYHISKIYWNFIYLIERFFVRFFIKQIFIRIKNFNYRNK